MPDLMVVAGIALKTSLLVVVAGLFSLALRRQSAAFQHLLWTLTLALCALMPAVVFSLPSHSVVTMPAEVLQLSSQTPTHNWTLAIWLLGSSFILTRELLAHIRLARWRRHAHPLTSTRWLTTLSRMSAVLGHDSRAIRVLESPHVASPCTWGVLRPVLLLPTAGDAWPESERRSALLHELAHLQRRDALSMLISRLACTVHWYNPLVWFAAGRVRCLQERACDDAVLRGGATPAEYAQFLLNVAAHVSGMSPPARSAIGMAHGSSLRTRIVAILDPAIARSQPQRLRVMAACVSLFAVTVLLATASAAIEDPPPPPSPTMLASTPRPVTPPSSIPAIPQNPSIAAIPAIPAVPPLPPAPAVPPKLPARPTQ